MSVNKRFREGYKLRYVISFLIALAVHGMIFIAGSDLQNKTPDRVNIYTYPKDSDNMKLVNISVSPPPASTPSEEKSSSPEEKPEEPSFDYDLDLSLTPPSIERLGVKEIYPNSLEVNTKPSIGTVNVPESAPHLKNIEEVLKALEGEYPDSLWKKNKSRLIVMNIHVSKEGSVISASIEKSSGSESLDNAVLSLLDIFQFNPAQDKNGNPLDTWVKLPIRFVPIK